MNAKHKNILIGMVVGIGISIAVYCAMSGKSERPRRGKKLLTPQDLLEVCEEVGMTLSPKQKAYLFKTGWIQSEEEIDKEIEAAKKTREFRIWLNKRIDKSNVLGRHPSSFDEKPEPKPVATPKIKITIDDSRERERKRQNREADEFLAEWDRQSKERDRKIHAEIDARARRRSAELDESFRRASLSPVTTVSSSRLDNERSGWIRYGATGELKENAYGLGTHSNANGRAVKYINARTGQRCSSLTEITPDAYGLGTHTDQFGRRIKVVPAHQFKFSK